MIILEANFNQKAEEVLRKSAKLYIGKLIDGWQFLKKTW